MVLPVVGSCFPCRSAPTVTGERRVSESQHSGTPLPRGGQPLLVRHRAELTAPPGPTALENTHTHTHAWLAVTEH